MLPHMPHSHALEEDAGVPACVFAKAAARRARKRAPRGWLISIARGLPTLAWGVLRAGADALAVKEGHSRFQRARRPEGKTMAAPWRRQAAMGLGSFDQGPGRRD